MVQARLEGEDLYTASYLYIIDSKTAINARNLLPGHEIKQRGGGRLSELDVIRNPF